MQSPNSRRLIGRYRLFVLVAAAALIGQPLTVLGAVGGLPPQENQEPAAAEPGESSKDETSVTDPWSTNAQASVQLAQKEARDMLLLFTGSDWCPPCIKLEKQILGKKEFVDSAGKQYVMVKFDFPENTQLPEDITQQNNAWAERFGVESFPTVILLDSEQRPFAFTGFRDEGPEAYLNHLGELRSARIERDKLLKTAANESGVKRAELLDQAMSKMDKSIVEVYYADVVDEIGKLDSDDVAGLRTKYFAQRDREIRQAVMSGISMISRLGKPQQAIEFIDEQLAEHKLPVDMWLVANTTKLRLLRKIDQVDQANKLCDTMIARQDIESETRQRLIINKAFYLAGLKRTDDSFQVLQKNIASNPDNLLLTIAVGELHDSLGQFEKAIDAYDQAIQAAANQPSILVELVGAKADAQFELKLADQALATLDSAINNQAIPGKLRAEVLLHKALLLREQGRRRAAILAENKAVTIVDDIGEKAEIQKLIDQFRRKFDSKNGS